MYVNAEFRNRPNKLFSHFGILFNAEVLRLSHVGDFVYLFFCSKFPGEGFSPLFSDFTIVNNMILVKITFLAGASSVDYFLVNEHVWLSDVACPELENTPVLFILQFLPPDGSDFSCGVFCYCYKFISLSDVT